MGSLYRPRLTHPVLFSFSQTVPPSPEHNPCLASGLKERSPSVSLCLKSAPMGQFKSVLKREGFWHIVPTKEWR